jgi:hypothetical protein
MVDEGGTQQEIVRVGVRVRFRGIHARECACDADTHYSTYM